MVVSHVRYEIFFKSEEEEWLKAIHPKIKKKVVRIWMMQSSDKKNYYATVKMHDKGSRVAHTHVYQSVGEVLIEVLINVIRAYEK